ncbi:TRAP transporter substrate-binding protein [Saccharopolyspora sp. ID03-671]|uniref:TRAP transporter substrate-binding protein n=1 Tax=Saccharopolyspora sp. ID03-671 TaxID=3073066 RepID=UPI003245366E
MSALSRRNFLAATGVGALAALTGCAPGAHRPVAATYLTTSYDDLYPGVERFLDQARALGGFDFDVFPSGQLLGAEELVPGLLNGVADVVLQTSSYVSSSFPILGSLELPFTTEHFDRYLRACDPASPVSALINERLTGQNMRMLGGMATGFEYLWTIDKPIRAPEDVRGLRLRVAGEIEGETVKALGGAPVFLGSAELYQALERGTIDGMMSYLGTVVSRDLQEILRYGTAAHFGAYTVDAYCRQDFYAALPPHQRHALDEAGKVLFRDGTATLLDVHQNQYLPAVRDAGVELIELDEAGLRPFRDAVSAVHERWRALLGDPVAAQRALDLIRTA